MDQIKKVPLYVWTLIVVTAAVLGFWYYWWNFAQLSHPPEGFNVVAERPKIDPSSFTEEDALLALKSLQSYSGFLFNLRHETRASTTKPIPEEVSVFVTPSPDEPVVTEASTGESGYYYLEYYSELALPENYMRLLRSANPAEFTMLGGKRNQLASSLELESAGYKINISQTAISEERTKVMIYAIPK